MSSASPSPLPEFEDTPSQDMPSEGSLTPDSTSADAAQFCQQAVVLIEQELGKVIVGQREVIRQILIAVFTRNHALLMGVPGLAKTLLISTLSQTLQLSFKRVQFTPDLMPSDITGTEVIYQNPETGQKEFRFLPGPLFANVVLADEINRTPPKTQAAMLEAMQERRVTVGGTTHKLPDPFFVLATQNPLEQEGTYPLPEAQLDRFLFLINVGYPTLEEEYEIMRRASASDNEKPEPVLNGDQIQFIQQTVRNITVAQHVFRYAETIVRSTRPKTAEAHPLAAKFLNFGAGPRASLGLIQAAKAEALMNGRLYVACADVAAVSIPILRHRIAVNFTGQSEGVGSDDVVRQIVASVPANETLN